MPPRQLALPGADQGTLEAVQVAGSADATRRRPLPHGDQCARGEEGGERLLKIATPFYKSRHNIELNDLAIKRITAGIDELKTRAKTVLQFVDESAFYAKTIPLTFDDKAKALSHRWHSEYLCNNRT